MATSKLDTSKYRANHSPEEEKLMVAYLQMKKGENIKSKATQISLLLMQQKKKSVFLFYAFIYLMVLLPLLWQIFVSTISSLGGLIVVICAYLLADLTSGLVHIYLDYSVVRFDGTMTDFNRMGFQVHHLYPNHQWMVHENYQPVYETVTVFPTVILISLLNRFTLNNLFIYYFTFFCLCFQAAHYFSHAVTHQKYVPKFVLLFQRIGLFINPKAHQKHHQTFDVNFCILAGLFDPILNKLVKNENLLKSYVSFMDNIL